MFANFADIKHLQSNEALIQIGSSVSIVKISTDNIQKALDDISNQAKKIFDSQIFGGISLLVFAPDETKFTNDNIVSVQGPYQNGYFLLRLKPGSSIEEIKEHLKSVPGTNVLPINGETHQQFASLPLQNPPIAHLRITSKFLVNQNNIRHIWELSEKLINEKVEFTGPYYDFGEPFVLINIPEGNTHDNFCRELHQENYATFRLDNNTHETLSKYPLLPKILNPIV